MELKPGYKETDVGVIPEDWEVKPLSSIVKYTNGKAHEQSITDSGNFVVVNSKFISTEGLIRKFAQTRFCPAEKGDVLMVMSDVPNGRAIAKCFWVDCDDTYTVNQRICVLNPNGVDGKLLYYKLDRNPFYLAFDDGAKQTNLRKEDVLSCPLSIPTEAEQNVIATALSDVDTLLNGLDRLIAKKRDLKQAAMQQLLTGKTRLPGFEGEWEVKRLDHLADILSGGTPSTAQSHLWDGGIPWCTPTDITALEGSKYLNETTRTISEAGLRLSSAETVPIFSVIMTSRATIGECAINTVPMTTNQGFKNLVPKDDVDCEFLYYLMTTQKARLTALCAGSTFLEIGKKQLSSFEILFPPSPDEQTAIATVLSDMDAEIAALEQRRNKTKDIKQAMMQELLTGKTRLVTPGGSNV
jgi:type I restriction enzyme S subunit